MIARRIGTLLIGLTFALAGCGGGSHSGVAVPANVARSATVSATLTIPSSGATAPARRRAQYVSSSTTWITFAVDGGTAQGFDASATSPACTAVANGRTCSFTIALGVVTNGAHTIAVKTYDANPTPGPANLLSANSETVTLTAGASNVALPLVLDGEAAAATIAVPSTTELTAGVTQNVPITLTVTDPDGKTIIGDAPFDGASVQLTIPVAAGTLVAMTSSGAETNGRSVTVTAPSTQITLQYTGTPLLDTSIGGTLTVTPVVIPLAAARIPGTVGTTNTLDRVTSIANARNRVVRGPDGDIYVPTSTGIGRIFFQADGSPATANCTAGSITDLAVSANNVIFAMTSTTVGSFAASAFVNGQPCPLTVRETLTNGDTFASLAASALGVFAFSYAPIGDPNAGSTTYISSFSSSGAPTATESAGVTSTSPVLGFGDPHSLEFGVFTTASGQVTLQLGVYQTTGAFNFGALAPLPSSDGASAPGIYSVGLDPNTEHVYVLDTSAYVDGDEPASPVLYDLTAGAQLGPPLPAFAAGQPVVALDDRVFVLADGVADEYNAPVNAFFTTQLSVPGGGPPSLGSAVLGADGRFYTFDRDSGYVHAFPGTGASI